MNDAVHYATGYSINANELFTRFPSKYIKLKAKGLYPKAYAASVWTYSFLVILEDIIENSTTFCLPIKYDSFIEMFRTSGEDFVKARQNGAFQDIDFLKSNFSGYQLQFRFRTKHNEIRKRVYVDSERKNKITEQTNNGKQYY